MQRKAIKQLNKVTQWTNEKVFSGEKTNFSTEFTDFEAEVEPRRIGIERLHATSLPFFEQLTKVKPSADPFPPGGASKEKIPVSEALGLVMISYGEEVGGALGDALAQYGRTRCKLAIAQEEFANRLSDGYLASMEMALTAVNDYKTIRKKLDSRRLTLDSAISRLKGSKKDSASLETEVDAAQQRFEEAEEETRLRMEEIQGQEQGQFDALADFVDAELDYFTNCKNMMEELRDSFPRSADAPSDRNRNRPRAKSNASAKSSAAGRSRAGSGAGARGEGVSRSFARNIADSDDESPSGNRSRSGSNASAGKSKEKRSMLPSFGSFGKKAGSSLAGVSSPRFSSRKDKYGSLSDDERRGALERSEADDDDDYEQEHDEPMSRSPSRGGYGSESRATGGGVGTGRARSQSSVTTYASVEASIPSSLAASQRAVAPPLRRSITSPPTSLRYVKALYDFSGGAADELSFAAGQIIEVKSEVSGDWWIGECDGASGLFPRAYTAEYVASPVGSGGAVPPPLPGTQRPRTLPPPAGGAGVGGGARRTLPPPAGGSPAVGSRYTPTTNEIRLDDDSEIESYDYSDGDRNGSAPPTVTTPTASSFPTSANRSRASSIKKPAPPPPPSRRSASSNNLETVTSAYLSPPSTSFGRARASTLSRTSSGTPLESSPEVSPFGGSDEEGEPLGSGSIGSLRQESGGASPSLPRTLSSGLGEMHIASAGGKAAAGECSCGCQDFTQNVFKPKGTCSNCFHQHPVE